MPIYTITVTNAKVAEAIMTLIASSDGAGFYEKSESFVDESSAGTAPVANTTQGTNDELGFGQDSAGVWWNAEHHASTGAKTEAGRWRRKRGGDKTAADAYEAAVIQANSQDEAIMQANKQAAAGAALPAASPAPAAWPAPAAPAAAAWPAPTSPATAPKFAPTWEEFAAKALALGVTVDQAKAWCLEFGVIDPMNELPVNASMRAAVYARMMHDMGA